MPTVGLKVCCIVALAKKFDERKGACRPGTKKPPRGGCDQSRITRGPYEPRLPVVNPKLRRRKGIPPPPCGAVEALERSEAERKRFGWGTVVDFNPHPKHLSFASVFRPPHKG